MSGSERIVFGPEPLLLHASAGALQYVDMCSWAAEALTDRTEQETDSETAKFGNKWSREAERLRSRCGSKQVGAAHPAPFTS